MKAMISITSGAIEHRAKIDIDDEVRAQACLAEEIAAIQQAFLKKPERPPSRSNDATRASAIAPTTPGGAK